MASGIIYLSPSSSVAWAGQIEWYSVTNTASNTSTVYADLYTWKTDGRKTSGGYSFKGTLTVGNNTITISSYQQEEPEKTWRGSISGYVVSHDASTGSATCYIGASIEKPKMWKDTNGDGKYDSLYTTLDGIILSGSSSVALDTINRSSSITSAGNTMLGNKCSVTWTPQSSSLYYELQFTLGGWDGYRTERFSPGVTSSYTYTGYEIPEGVAEYMNSVSASMQVTLYTYQSESSSSSTGFSQESFTVTIPPSLAPTIDSVSLSIVNDAVDAMSTWDVGVAGFSKIKITANASALYDAEILSYHITGSYNATVKSLSGEGYTGAIITTPGDKWFKITCTDSRGMTSEVYNTQDKIGLISFLSYVKPEITNVSTEKETFGDKDAANDRMRISAKWEYDDIGGRNSSYATIQYKTSVASGWIDYKDASGNVPKITSSGDSLLLEDLKLEEEASYYFKVIVTDLLGSTSDKSSFTSTEQVLLDFRAGGKGLGIGKICETDCMEVSMDAVFYNNISIVNNSVAVRIDEYIKRIAYDAIYPVGSIYMTLNGASSPQILFGGTWEQIKDVFLIGASDIYELGSYGGEEKVTLSISEMPSHNHNIRSPAPNVRLQVDPSWDDSDIYPWHNYQDQWSNAGISETGGGMPHNNIPPYLAVYMWKRTA